MALPKFNETPVYQLTIPSTKRIVKFRPFLVKEQKILLIALESQDERQILEAIMNCIDSCTLEKINLPSLATFDIEYMFMQIRDKSVGEKTKLIFSCRECQTECETEVDLEDITIDIPEGKNQIKVNDQYIIQMRYPNYGDLIKELKDSNDKSAVEKLYDLVYLCMDSLLSDEEKISFRDETKEEVESFLDSLNPETFEKILTFTQNLPTLTKEAKYHCKVCEKEYERTLKGINDFFLYASPTSL